MHDDWDGENWADHFSGPDDAEFERRNREEFETSQSPAHDTTQKVAATVHHDDSSVIFLRKDEFATFDEALSHAKKSSLDYRQIFKVERVKDHWKSTIDRSYLRFDDELELIRVDPPYLAGIELVETLRKRERTRALQILEGEVDVESLGLALTVAAYRGYADICERLLSMGAAFEVAVNIDHDDPRRRFSEEYDDPIDTVMHRANLSRDWPTIEVIGKAYVTAEWHCLKALSAEDPSGFQYFCLPRLVSAAGYGMTALCVEMITSGVEINQYRDPNKFFSEPNESPLVAAFENKHKSTCLVLIALGADIRDLERSMTSMGAFKLMYEITKNFLDTDTGRTE